MALLLSLGVFVLGFHHLQSLPGSWPRNYHTVRLRGNINLTCPVRAEKIFWNVPANNCVRGSQQHKTLHLHSLDHSCTGLYTCANAHNKSQSYSQYLLIDQGHSSLSFFCSMDSYTSSVLHCSLDEELSGPGLVRVKAYSFNMNQNWTEMPIPEDAKPLSKFDVPLPDFCRFEEQVNPIQVSVEVISDGDYLSGHRSFYMRDVVVPRAPESMCISREQIIWSNPSWTRHPSFFPLLFQLKVNYRNNSIVTKTTEEQSYNVKDIRTFSVRCRDLYNPSSWSTWSETLKISSSSSCSMGHRD